MDGAWQCAGGFPVYRTPFATSGSTTDAAARTSNSFLTAPDFIALEVEAGSGRDAAARALVMADRSNHTVRGSGPPRCGIASRVAWAQTYPVPTVTMVVLFAAGGPDWLRGKQ
jgi:hypothetical protein